LEKIESNIIFDSQRGLQIPAKGTKDIEIKNNIFYRLNHVNPDDDNTYASFVYQSSNITVANNTYVDIPTNSKNIGIFFKFYNTSDGKFIDNIAIFSSGASDNKNNTVDNNYFYNTSNIHLNGTNDHVFEAEMSDYTFTCERFTKTPKQKN